MAKLVVLSAGMTGRTHELKVDKTTIGRVEDNTFEIAESSVSSHHCEVLLKGSDVLVRDLNSTNGTFINGQKISESVLKPGQILRLGQVEMRLETDTPATTTKKQKDQTMVMQRGVSLNELDAGPRGAIDSKACSKKDNKVNNIFVIIGIAFGVVILGLLRYVFMIVRR
jgi:pSer/pThr/pTyr-binding forkhead associated (FHA) protein